MINKLRFRFIRITMLSIFIVLVMIISAINIVNINRNERSLDAITQRISESHFFAEDRLGENARQEPDFSGISRGQRFPLQNERELPFSARFFTIRTDKDGKITKFNLRRIVSVTESDLEAVKDAILAEGVSVGWYHTYRYRVAEIDSGYLLIVLEATSTLNSLINVLAVTLAVGTVSFVFLFAAIAILSKRAIRPIAEAQEKQKRFITDAGHELKTPLTVISANAEILSLSYGENEWCEGILRQTKAMGDLVSRMIQMAKLDEGEIKNDGSVFDLSGLVSDTVKAFEAPAVQRSLELNAEISPDISIRGNELSIRQAVSALMDNAVKYCDQGGEIHVRLGRTGKRKGVLLTVTNTFAAVDTLDTEHLFDRFYRNDKARDSKDSFGLGLSIARSAVERHKGTLICRKTGNGEIQFVMTLR